MKLILLTLFTLISILTFSQGNENTNVGNKALDFEIATLDGSNIQLSKLHKEKPVVLIVLRGWPGYQCPICTRQVGSLVADEDKFNDLGAAVLIIYPGPSDDLQAHADEFTEDFSIPENFYFTVDPNYSMVNSYGLRWDAPGETAYPSTFVINKEGEIIFSKISTTHGGRADNNELIEVLQKL